MSDQGSPGSSGPTGYVGVLRTSMGSGKIIVGSAAACVRDSAGRILLVQRGGESVWGFPGGALEIGESVADAVVREIREETSLDVRPTALIGVYSRPEYAFTYPNGDQVQPLTVLLECEVLSGHACPDGVEVTTTAYFGPNEPLPPMRPCCVAKARDAFAFCGIAQIS